MKQSCDVNLKLWEIKSVKHINSCPNMDYFCHKVCQALETSADEHLDEHPTALYIIIIKSHAAAWFSEALGCEGAFPRALCL